MTLEKSSPCKVNLLLNILGQRPDGFHELETIFQPINYCDHLTFTRAASGVTLTCSDASLPTDATNLVHRAAAKFLEAARLTDGVRLHLEKKIPMAAGLGGGSGNAATTLLGLNELFGAPLPLEQLHTIAATLGSDVNFFLQSQPACEAEADEHPQKSLQKTSTSPATACNSSAWRRPALATGRGEHIQPLAPFPALRGACFLLIHPGFGISTPWAYRELARFPAARNGQPGRAQKLITTLQTADLAAAGREFYNSLEAPALDKFPVLALYQEFLRAHGAAATLMSGSGSTTFAIFPTQAVAETAGEQFKSRFGASCWTTVVPI